MSEEILKALMQLFAIISRPESDAAERRLVVESFLNRQLNQELVAVYLDVFDGFFSQVMEEDAMVTKKERLLSRRSAHTSSRLERKGPTCPYLKSLFQERTSL